MKTFGLFMGLLLGISAFAQGPVEIRPGAAMDLRTPIAVPMFAAQAGFESIAEEMTRVIRYDLDFSGEFIVLPDEQFPPNAARSDPDPLKIDFPAWQNTRAEMLVHCHLKGDPDGSLKPEFRLFDVKSATQVTGKILPESRKWARHLAHLFADEIVRQATGTAGVASSQICFSVGQPGKKEIYIAEYDGANARALTAHNSISIKPEFSPDGAKIAYVSYKEGYQFIYILTLSSGESVPLSRKVGMNSSPAWAPDGNSLAITLSKDGNSEIYTLNADGSNSLRLTDNKVLDTSPTYSPDGGQIAYISESQGKAQIYAMGRTGGNVRRLSFQGGASFDPVWSPDGKKIAYVAEQPGDGAEIYVLDVANPQNAIRLTNSSGSNESPSWSSDSRHLMFQSTRQGKPELDRKSVV